MLKRINNVLPELILGICVFGVIVQLAGVWFVEDKLKYSSGLWIGILVAVGMAIHMAVVILDSVDAVVEKKARKRATLFSILRYVVVVLIFLVVFYLKLGNILMMFVGVMGLKIAAYLQPLTHKIVEKFTRR